MKVSFAVIFVAVAFLAVVSAVPVLQDLQHQGLSLKVKEEPSSLGEQQFDEEPETPGPRHRRATCDLLSVSTPIGSLNHSACAAHCLAMMKGFRGGRCIDGVCHCRR